MTSQLIPPLASSTAICTMEESPQRPGLSPRIGHANDLARGVAALLRRVDAEQRALGFVGEQVEQAVGALADVADAVVEVAEDTFAVEFFPLVVEIDTLQVTGTRDFAFAHAAHEQIV